MRDLYPRLFEPPFIEPDVPNPRHLDQGDYLALARAAAVRGARRNGVRVSADDVSFPGGALRAHARDGPGARCRARRPDRAGDRRTRIPVRATRNGRAVAASGGELPAQRQRRRL